MMPMGREPRHLRGLHKSRHQSAKLTLRCVLRFVHLAQPEAIVPLADVAGPVLDLQRDLLAGDIERYILIPIRGGEEVGALELARGQPDALSTTCHRVVLSIGRRAELEFDPFSNERL